MSIDKSLTDIFNIIEEVKAEDPGAAAILMEGFGLSLNLLQEVIKNQGRKEIDISEHLEVITSILGISLKDLVMHIIQSQPEQVSDKEPDAATLEFITSDLDDYEKFLAQNQAKEDLTFLSKEL